jgi:hypothetical protein
VIDDWIDDGIVSATHGIPCYRRALASLPEDLRSYTSAVDDIERAFFSVHPDAVRLGAG